MKNSELNYYNEYEGKGLKIIFVIIIIAIFIWVNKTSNRGRVGTYEEENSPYGYTSQ